VSVTGEATTGPLRLAELVAALSLATDLGTGQPLEHALRTCLLSLELARRSGVATADLADVYYLALLRFVGCTADAAETAAASGGDDIAFIGAMSPAWMGSTGEQVRAMAGATGPDAPLPRRLRLLLAAFADTQGAVRSIGAHCEAAQMLSVRLGVSSGVTESLGLAFERWDGTGIPGRHLGQEVPAPVRVVVVARDIELWTRLADLDTAVEVVRGRAGKAYDPAVAAAFVDDPRGVLEMARTDDIWQATLAAEPTPWLRVHDDRLDTALGAFGDFADLKSPWTRGHSSGVARLAAAAGAVAGLATSECDVVYRAGLVHDLGRVGVPNGVWDHPGPLTVQAWERVRLHSYLTERILSRSARLAPLARLCGCHHERMDGSGYHRGAKGSDLTGGERILAAADAYHALTEQRPHRGAFIPDQAAEELRRDVRAGRFDADDVECVLEAAGHDVFPRPSAPAGLTEREVQVLQLIARGNTNRQVAQQLSITSKTVGTHVEHIYLKAGVSTRAGAALFAMEHGLL
jgi:HD-GYP domain-containing protein (c-di-GMP phosphodiesterase class II)